jgi:hypothetical protein
MRADVAGRLRDGAVLRAWMDLAVPALTAARARIDSVNVFPVADGDTGTNVLLTVRGAAEAVRSLGPSATDTELLGALGRGAQLAARGSSGMILSRYLGGLAESADAPLPEALLRAAVAARGAVHQPEDGTVLTLAARVAAAARASAGDEADALTEAVEAGRADLAEISSAHPVLRSARVVDAGACALLVLLDALLAALRGAAGPVDVSWLAKQTEPAGHPEHLGHLEHLGHAERPGHTGPTEPAEPAEPAEQPGYAGAERATASGADEHLFEVLVVLRATGPGAAARLRTSLATTGDAVAVVDGDGLLTAHVHADDPAVVLAAVGATGAIEGTWTATVRVLVGRSGPVVACTAHPALAGTLALAGAVVLVVPDDVPADHVRDAVVRAVQDAGTPAHGTLPTDDAVPTEDPAPTDDAVPADDATPLDAGAHVVVLPGDRLPDHVLPLHDQPRAAGDVSWGVRAEVADELRVVAAVVAGPGATTTTASCADQASALDTADRLFSASASVPLDDAGAVLDGVRTLTVLLGRGATLEDGLELVDVLGARHPEVPVALAGPVPTGPAFGLAVSEVRP